MKEDIVILIAYTKFDGEINPNPILCLPKQLSKYFQTLVKNNIFSFLANEKRVVPDSLVIFPIPSLNLKSILKFIERNDESHRKEVFQSVIVIIFDKVEYLTLLKYLPELELQFNNIAQKIVELEETSAEIEKFVLELTKLRTNIINMLYNSSY
ncbi:MAG: hypothetical protein ACTSRI_08040 [Promethearchaeota archaeon]